MGVEGTGEVLFVDLSESDAQLPQRYKSPFEGVMALDYNFDMLRVMCDEKCEGASILLELDGEWKPVSDVQARPAVMEDFANEGFASHTSRTECTDGKIVTTTRLLWADDGVSNGASLRAAKFENTLDCKDVPLAKVAGSSTPGGILAAIIALLSLIGGAFYHWAKVSNLLPTK